MKQLNDRNKKRVKKQPQKIAFFYFNFFKKELHFIECKP